jgi:hypothetical protein
VENFFSGGRRISAIYTIKTGEIFWGSKALENWALRALGGAGRGRWRFAGRRQVGFEKRDKIAGDSRSVAVGEGAPFESVDPKIEMGMAIKQHTRNGKTCHWWRRDVWQRTRVFCRNRGKWGKGEL